MTNTAVANRYAGALVDLAAEQKCLDPVAADLESFGAILAGSAPLSSALTNPGFSREEQRGVVGKILDLGKPNIISRNFLYLLVDNSRMGAYADILEAFRDRYDDMRGRVRASVTSASPLDAGTLKTLESHVKLLTGKETVVLETNVDPALIGGIVTHVGDMVLDGSIRTQLANLRTRLLGQVVGEA